MQKIGEILVEKGYVTQQQIDGVMAVKGEGAQVGQVLIQWGLLTQEQLMEALDIQAPPPPPPPPPPPVQPQQPVQPGFPPQPGYPPQPQVAQPTGTPDLSMDTIQKSKFNIDVKTMIWVGSMLVSGVTMYFTFMSELDTRFGALESQDNTLVVDMDKRLTSLETNMDKRLTDLENKFTPIGDGVYSVDPNTTWPPSRGEYTMKQNMNANKITVLEETIDRLEKELEKIEEDLDDKQDKQ
jgi:hypothetical protein